MSPDKESYLKEYIRESSTDVESLERNRVYNLPKLKILKAKNLDPFWLNRLNKNDLYIICFDSNVIDNLDFDLICENLESHITEELKTKNLVHVNEKFEILNSDIISGDFHKPLIDLSKPKRCAFFFGPKGIDTCIDGEIIDKLNYFYDVPSIKQYEERFHLGNIDNCFDFYQKQILPLPTVCRIFFADKSVIEKITPGTKNYQILRNKPEKDLHGHLLDFLNLHTQHDFYKEIELQVTKRETDIFTEWDGKKYLFEVKWLGQSINKNADGLSSPVTDSEARDGVTQTLEYVRELIKHLGDNLKYASLIVFDARENKKEINFKDFQFISDELRPYFRERFATVRKLDITNITPS